MDTRVFTYVSKLTILLILAAPVSADTLRVFVTADVWCGHIEITNQTTGERDLIMLSDLTGNEPTDNKYVLLAREYMDSRGITRSALTKFIARNLLDGATVDLSKYLRQ